MLDRLLNIWNVWLQILIVNIIDPVVFEILIDEMRLMDGLYTSAKANNHLKFTTSFIIVDIR